MTAAVIDCATANPAPSAPTQSGAMPMNALRVETNGQGRWVIYMDDHPLAVFGTKEEAEAMALWLSARLASHDHTTNSDQAEAK